MPLQHLPRAPWRLVRTAATWPVASQQHARRNALVASTALTARRRERNDVEDFLATLAQRTEPRPARPARTHTA